MNQLAYQLKQLIRLLKKAEVDYAVIGGLAVSVYGEPRLTLDIDVSIVLGDTEISPFLKLSKKYGFTPIPSNIFKFAKKTAVLPMAFSKKGLYGRCDLIIAQNSIEYLTIERARLKYIYGIKIKIVSPEDLLIHKITSQRPRDKEDARGIFIRQRKRLDMKYIKYWLNKIAKSNNYPQLLTEFKNLRK